MKKMLADEIIETLGLEKLQIEGGMYKQSYRSSENLLARTLPKRYTIDKPFYTAILYLLSKDTNTFSALHRLPTDEIYHFYLGDPVEMLLLHPNNKSQRVILGQNIVGGQQVQFLVPRGVWQGTRLLPNSNFALMGTTMAPGFTDDDFEAGKREYLIKEYPNESNFIQLFLPKREG